MVKLQQLPEYEIILGLKGTVDFACWKGIIYARKWPKYTGYNTTPNVVRNQAPFAYIKQQPKQVGPEVVGALTAMVVGTQRVYSDEQVSLYYGYDVVFPQPECLTTAFDEGAFDCESFT